MGIEIAGDACPSIVMVQILGLHYQIPLCCLCVPKFSFFIIFLLQLSGGVPEHDTKVLEIGPSELDDKVLRRICIQRKAPIFSFIFILLLLALFLVFFCFALFLLLFFLSFQFLLILIIHQKNQGFYCSLPYPSIHQKCKIYFVIFFLNISGFKSVLKCLSMIFYISRKKKKYPIHS